MDGVEVEVVQQVTGELVEAFARLLPQLSRSAAPLDASNCATRAYTGFHSSAADPSSPPLHEARAVQPAVTMRSRS